MNNIYRHKEEKREMFPDGKLVRLINEEKVDGYEGPRESFTSGI